MTKRCIYLAFFGPLQQLNSDFDKSDFISIYNANHVQTIAQTPAAREETIQDERFIPQTQDLIIYLSAGSSVMSLYDKNNSNNLISFVDINGLLITKIAFSRDAIKTEARKYTETRRSIMDEKGKALFWEDCYDDLINTETHKLIILNLELNIARKRRNESLHDVVDTPMNASRF